MGTRLCLAVRVVPVWLVLPKWHIRRLSHFFACALRLLNDNKWKHILYFIFIRRNYIFTAHKTSNV